MKLRTKKDFEEQMDKIMEIIPHNSRLMAENLNRKAAESTKGISETASKMGGG